MSTCRVQECATGDTATRNLEDAEVACRKLASRLAHLCRELQGWQALPGKLGATQPASQVCFGPWQAVSALTELHDSVAVLLSVAAG